MKNKIAEKLKNLIKEENITTNKLSKAIGVTNSVVYYWVQGKTTPNADYIIAICNYFGICADYLLGRQDWH